MALPLLLGLGALGTAAIAPTAINISNKLNNSSGPIDYSQLQIGDAYSPIKLNSLNKYDALTSREQELRNNMASMIKAAPEVLDPRNRVTTPTFYESKEMTPNEVSTQMSAASLNNVPERTVKTPEPVNTTTPTKTNTSTQPRTVSSSGSTGSTQKNNKPQVNNSLSGFNALIPLLALGGLGYYMARR